MKSEAELTPRRAVAALPPRAPLWTPTATSALVLSSIVRSSLVRYSRSESVRSLQRDFHIRRSHCFPLGADSGRRERATATHPATTKKVFPSRAVCHDAVDWGRERERVKENVETSTSGAGAACQRGAATNRQSAPTAGSHRRQEKTRPGGRPSERGAHAILGRGARGTA